MMKLKFSSSSSFVIIGATLVLLSFSSQEGFHVSIRLATAFAAPPPKVILPYQRIKECNTIVASTSWIIINKRNSGRQQQLLRQQGRRQPHQQQRLNMALALRGGEIVGSAAAASWSSILSQLGVQSPQSLFNSSLLGLAMATLFIRVLSRSINSMDSSSSSASAAPAVVDSKPESIQSLQARFLPVFWLLRCSDWLQGPYFYEVYTSKVFQGQPASMALVSKLFLTGFASRALFGPKVGEAADQYGRKKATLALCVIYAIGALSTKSPLLIILLLGRVLSGIGTALLYSAPESWLVGEAQKSGDDPNGKYLGETFGLAYAGDSIVAIGAGQLAGYAATRAGPTGPFVLSSGFLALAALLTAVLWKENSYTTSEKPTIDEAIQVIRKDPKIILVGTVQSLFEAAMYIFVLQWPPAISSAVGTAFGGSATTPYGTVFSCLMASCLLGSTIFGQLARTSISTETSATAMLSVATIAMSIATWTVTTTTAASSSSSIAGGIQLAMITAAFFAFEACVGMYFPSIGTLRSKYIPDSHRSVIMNLFGIPLNILVVSVFLSIHKLGIGGALAVSSVALGLATFCMTRLEQQQRSIETTTQSM